jgi:hypothetical protein
MKLLSATAFAIVFVASCGQAAAWDADEWDAGWDNGWDITWDEPAYAPEPVDIWEDVAQPVWEPAPSPDRDAAMQELGLHAVTEVRDRDVVTTVGDRTTYETTTLTESPGTAARLVAEVGTGEATGFESSGVVGRLERDDGQLASGALYENFFWGGESWVSNGLYFFNADSELRPQASPGAGPTEAVGGSTPSWPAGEAASGTAPSGRSPSWSPEAGDVLWSGTLTDPHRDRPEDESAPRGAGGGPPPSGPSAARHDVRVGIALQEQGDPLTTIEVLRGRQVRLWPRAFVDGVPEAVVSWRLASGELTALGPVAGGADAPLAAMWEHVGVADAPFLVSIEADVVVPGQGIRTITASIDVGVRSPALVE